MSDLFNQSETAGVLLSDNLLPAIGMSEDRNNQLYIKTLFLTSPLTHLLATKSEICNSSILVYLLHLLISVSLSVQSLLRFSAFYLPSQFSSQMKMDNTRMA